MKKITFNTRNWVTLRRMQIALMNSGWNIEEDIFSATGRKYKTILTK